MKKIVLVTLISIFLLVLPLRAQINLLHQFTGTNSSDGSWPLGSLIVSGSTIYGMTSNGGSGMGTIFRMNMDGTGFFYFAQIYGGSKRWRTSKGISDPFRWDPIWHD